VDDAPPRVVGDVGEVVPEVVEPPEPQAPRAATVQSPAINTRVRGIGFSSEGRPDPPVCGLKHR
jgi:hypothetical protein